MPAVTTPALVLHVIPYGDTSKIVRLLTRDLGLQSAMAKGARRPRSRAGPGLDLFSEGQASLFVRPNRELNTLTAFEVTSSRGGLASGVAAFAAANALAELALRFGPPEPNPDLFEATLAGLDDLERAPASLVDTVGLVACWRVVVALGFRPTLERCAVCGAGVGGAMAFSAAHGGALCRTHRGEARTARLGQADSEALHALVGGRLPEPGLTARHEAAHRRLLLQFVRHHLAEQRPLPALAFWDSRPWTHASS